ncbi:unnamed protein product [Closterium sp. NIES-64]|nr:unnamed protein product [Closterium sp. NIES-64]
MSPCSVIQETFYGAPTGEVDETLLTSRESQVGALDSVDESFMASCGFVSNTTAPSGIIPSSATPLLSPPPLLASSGFGLRVNVPTCSSETPSLSAGMDDCDYSEGEVAAHDADSTGIGSDGCCFPSSLSESSDAASDNDFLCSPHSTASGSLSPLSVLSPARATPHLSQSRATRRALWPEAGSDELSKVPANSAASAGPSTWQEGNQWQLPEDRQAFTPAAASPPGAAPIAARNASLNSNGQHSAQAAQSFPHGAASASPYCFAVAGGAGAFPMYWPYPGAFPAQYPPIGLCAQDRSAAARGANSASGTSGEAMGCKKAQAQKPAGVIIPPLGFWGHPQAPAVTLPPGVQLPLRLQVQLQLQQMAEGAQQRQHLPVAVQAPVANCPRAYLPPSSNMLVFKGLKVL